MSAAATALKVMVFGEKDISVEAEIGFLMLAKVFHCYVIDHKPRAPGQG